MSIVVRLELGSSTAAVPLKALPSGSSLPSVFLFSNLSLLSKRNFRGTLLLISSLEIFRPWRRRLGERRPSPLPATSASSRYAAPAPSLSLCCARLSTPNPNKTICIRIWIQLQYIELPTNLDFVCKNKNYRVYMCTPMSYAGSAPAWDLPLFSNSNANSSLPFIFLRRKLVVYWRKFIGHGEIACECLQKPSLAVANMHRLDLSFPLNWAHMLCFQLLGCINSNTEE